MRSAAPSGVELVDIKLVRMDWFILKSATFILCLEFRSDCLAGGNASYDTIASRACMRKMKRTCEMQNSGAGTLGDKIPIA